MDRVTSLVTPTGALEQGFGFSLDSRAYLDYSSLSHCTSSRRWATGLLMETASLDLVANEHKKGSHLPDFWIGEPQEVLWPDNICSRDAALEFGIGRRDGTANSSLLNYRDPVGSAGCKSGATPESVSDFRQKWKLPEVVEALGVLVQADCPISQSFFYSALKRGMVLTLGRRVHALVVRAGCESDTFLCNHIMRMYASHGRLQEAMDVFTAVSKPDAFTWSAIITAHVKHGRDKQALQLYHEMRRSSVKPDGHVFVAALQACARAADLETGQQVHADVLASGVEPNLFVCNCLVDMYAKCGSLENAQTVFDELDQKDVVTWNAMITGYSQRGMGQTALILYSDMREEAISAPTSVTFVGVLQACASVGAPALEKGRRIHAQIQEQELEGDVVVGSSLVNMYAKCGSLEDAQRVFDGLSQKNVVTWNAMMAGYSQQNLGEEALHLYIAMQEEGIATPDSVTFVCLLQACASVGIPALEYGRHLHAQIAEQGLQTDSVVGCSLVNMYAKCGHLEDAQSVFDGLDEKTVVTWTALIAGYAQQGMGQEALDRFSAMQADGIAVPNSVTFVCLLQACARVGTQALGKGKQLHAQIREQGLQVDLFLGCSLVNMYAKCGSLDDAQRVFDGLCTKNVVMCNAMIAGYAKSGSLEEARGLFDRLDEKNVATWNAMIAGNCQQGMGQEALSLYTAMQEEGMVAADSLTFACLLQACANVAALQLGRQLHAQTEERGLQADVLVAVSLINMYSKSGSMVDAQQVFEALPRRDVVAWNALIAGYTYQGDSQMVFESFHRMAQEGKQPDDITVLSILTVCSHAGLVGKAQEHFEAMTRQYGIIPRAEHYTCMVDLMGRAGQLEEALALVRVIPAIPDAAVWHTLLGACQKWSNVEVGCHAFAEAVKLDEKDAAAYVLMSNVYTSAQMWEKAREIQARRTGVGAWKEPGQSWWTDVHGVVHTFSVGDKVFV